MFYYLSIAMLSTRTRKGSGEWLVTSGERGQKRGAFAGTGTGTFVPG